MALVLGRMSKTHRGDCPELLVDYEFHAYRGTAVGDVTIPSTLLRIEAMSKEFAYLGAGSRGSSRAPHREGLRPVMTGHEFKNALRRLGRTQIGFSHEIGVSRRTVHLWAERGPPAHAIYLISLIERYAVPTEHQTSIERPLPDPAAALDSMLSVAASSGMRHEFVGAVEDWLANHRWSDH